MANEQAKVDDAMEEEMQQRMSKYACAPRCESHEVYCATDFMVFRLLALSIISILCIDDHGVIYTRQYAVRATFSIGIVCMVSSTYLNVQDGRDNATADSGGCGGASMKQQEDY